MRTVFLGSETVSIESLDGWEPAAWMQEDVVCRVPVVVTSNHNVAELSKNWIDIEGRLGGGNPVKDELEGIDVTIGNL